MFSLETFQTEVFAVMETLVDAAVTEVRTLLEDRTHPEDRRQPEEDEESNKVTQFASLMTTWTKGAAEKISMLLKVSVGESEGGSVAGKRIAPYAGRAARPQKQLSPRRRRQKRKNVDDVIERSSRGKKDHRADVAAHVENHSGSLSDQRNPALTESVSDAAEHAVQVDVDSPELKDRKARAEPIRCPSCDKTFALKCFFERHFLHHSKPHLCSQCGKRFARPEGLVAHSRRHSGDKPFACRQCGTRFAYKSTFNRHMRQHSARKERTHTCTLCEGEFAGALALQRHRCGALTKTFVCSLCPRTFERRESLADHENLHSGDRHFVCEICGNSFLSSASLSTHRVTHTETRRCCEELGLGCSDMSVLRNHLSRHSGEKPLTCEVCGKGCSHQSALKHHMLTHTGERPYVCETCGKRCGHASALQNHMRIHTGQKPGQPAVCDVCGKRLSTRVKLRYHMSTHTGEKPYSCHQCGKTFTNPSNLRTHSVTHTGEKRYGCAVCGRRFTQASSLKVHRRLHTGEVLY